MKVEYQKNPTEQIQMRLEVKLQLLRRVDDQLRQLTSESAAAAAQVSEQVTCYSSLVSNKLVFSSFVNKNFIVYNSLFSC